MDLEHSRLTRRGFVALTGATSLSALLAACGGDDGGDGGAAPPETGASTGDAAAAATFDPASEPDGPITFFEWAGYDKTSPWMWEAYTEGEYGQRSPLKFDFLENDIQALAKVASGYSPDVIHPCIAYWPDFHAAGLIQPFDKALLPDYEGIPEAIRGPGVGEDGLVYHVPFDIGFSRLRLPGGQDSDHAGGGVLEHPPRSGVRGEARDLLGPRHDHQDRRAHQRRRADRPEQAHVRADRGGEGDDDRGQAADPELLGRQPGQHRRLHQRQRLGRPTCGRTATAGQNVTRR